MCPNCRAFITTADRVCPYCEVQLGPRVADLRGSQTAQLFVPRLNSVSLAILTINLIWFLIEVFTQSALGQGINVFHVNLDLGFSYAPYIFHGQWWRLVTAGFLHEGLLHIAMNSYALLILVSEADQFYGTSRFIVGYIFTIVTGYVLSCTLHPQVASLGASGAIFGLIGMMLAVTVGRRTHPLAHLVRMQYTQWLVFGIVLSFWGNDTDWAAHIGGAIGGFLFGLIAGLPSLPGSPRESFWRAAAACTVALTLYCFYRDFAWVMQALHNS